MTTVDGYAGFSYMVNHVRTLILNKSGNIRPASSFPGEIYIPWKFKEVSLPWWLKLICDITFGSEPDDLMSNYRIAQIMQILHGSEYNYLVTSPPFDTRLTYTLLEQTIFDTDYGTEIVSTNLPDVSAAIVGSFVGDSGLGHMMGHWQIITTGFTAAEVTDLLHNRIYSRSFNIEADGSVLIPIDANLSLRISEAPPIGSAWELEAADVPGEMGEVVAALEDALPQEALIELFGAGETEPYASYRRLWINGSSVSQRLVGLVMAMANRTEVLRAGTNPIEEEEEEEKEESSSSVVSSSESSIAVPSSSESSSAVPSSSESSSAVPSSSESSSAEPSSSESSSAVPSSSESSSAVPSSSESSSAIPSSSESSSAVPSSSESSSAVPSSSESSSAVPSSSESSSAVPSSSESSSAEPSSSESSSAVPSSSESSSAVPSSSESSSAEPSSSESSSAVPSSSESSSAVPSSSESSSAVPSSSESSSAGVAGSSSSAALPAVGGTMGNNIHGLEDYIYGPMTMYTGTHTGNDTADRVLSGWGFRPYNTFIKSKTALALAWRAYQYGTKAATLDLYDNGILRLTENGTIIGTHGTVNVNPNDYWDVGLGFASDGLTRVKARVGSYIGDGNDDRNLADLGIDPDFVIIKGEGSRTAVWKSDQHGTGSSFFTNVADADNMIQSLISGGVQVGNHDNVNTNSVVYHYLALEKSVDGNAKMCVGCYFAQYNDDYYHFVPLPIRPDWMLIAHEDYVLAQTGPIISSKSMTMPQSEQIIVGPTLTDAVMELLDDGIWLGPSNKVQYNRAIYMYLIIQDDEAQSSSSLSSSSSL